MLYQTCLERYLFCSDSHNNLRGTALSEETKAPSVYVTCVPTLVTGEGDSPPHLTPDARLFHNTTTPPGVSYSIFSKSIRIQAESTNKSIFCMPRVQYRWIGDTSLSPEWWAILVSRQLHKTSVLHHPPSQGLEDAGEKCWLHMRKSIVARNMLPLWRSSD